MTAEKLATRLAKDGKALQEAVSSIDYGFYGGLLGYGYAVKLPPLPATEDIALQRGALPSAVANGYYGGLIGFGYGGYNGYVCYYVGYPYFNWYSYGSPSFGHGYPSFGNDQSIGF